MLTQRTNYSHQVFRALCLWGILAVFLTAGVPRATADVIYVNRYAPGANNGTSWKDAYTDLQLALTASGSGDEIWVSAGIHRPSVVAGGTDERHKTFQLKNGVALYGGFAGDETTRSQRNWTANPTYLCGDLGYTGYDADNNFHVFYHPFGLYLNQSAILDGFVVRNSRAYSTGSGHEGYGGGMYTDDQKLHIFGQFCVERGRRDL